MALEDPAEPSREGLANGRIRGQHDVSSSPFLPSLSPLSLLSHLVVDSQDRARLGRQLAERREELNDHGKNNDAACSTGGQT